MLEHLRTIRRPTKSPWCDFMHRVLVGGIVALIIIAIGVLQWAI